MQTQVSQMREQMASKTVEGSAGGGLVTLTLSGEKILKRIAIKPECVDPSDVEALQDLILFAFADAAAKLQQQESESPSSSFPFMV